MRHHGSDSAMHQCTLYMRISGKLPLNDSQLERTQMDTGMVVWYAWYALYPKSKISHVHNFQHNLQFLLLFIIVIMVMIITITVTVSSLFTGKRTIRLQIMCIQKLSSIHLSLCTGYQLGASNSRMKRACRQWVQPSIIIPSGLHWNREPPNSTSTVQKIDQSTHWWRGWRGFPIEIQTQEQVESENYLYKPVEVRQTQRKKGTGIHQQVTDSSTKEPSSSGSPLLMDCVAYARRTLTQNAVAGR